MISWVVALFQLLFLTTRIVISGKYFRIMVTQEKKKTHPGIATTLVTKTYKQCIPVHLPPHTHNRLLYLRNWSKEMKDNRHEA